MSSSEEQGHLSVSVCVVAVPEPSKHWVVLCGVLGPGHTYMPTSELREQAVRLSR